MEPGGPPRAVAAGHAAHNPGEREGLQALRAAVAARLPGGPVRCVRVAGGAAAAPAPAGAKKVHLIRHGEGHHNVAQREWRALPDWDGVSEPYTADNDPDSRYQDAELTELGREQARELQPLTAALEPQLLVVSPMRRATQTGLIAFERHIASGALGVVAHDLCHERAGKHTCDRRLPRAQLQAAFPSVDYALVEEEEDPYWGDGTTRESLEQLAQRCASFVEWLMGRPEAHLAVAAHSAFLLGVTNAVLDCSSDESVGEHFATGEMRTVLLTRSPGRRAAPGICQGGPFVSAGGSAPPARDYVILSDLDFSARPVSLSVCGQEVDVRQEPAGFMARGLRLAGASEAVVRLEDGSEETLELTLQHVC